MKTSQQDYSFIEEALPAFISEAQEQIESLEQLLLQLEDSPGDRELLDALFRCLDSGRVLLGRGGLPLDPADPPADRPAGDRGRRLRG